jgi:hypothetical protein
MSLPINDFSRNSGVEGRAGASQALGLEPMPYSIDNPFGVSDV